MRILIVRNSEHAPEGAFGTWLHEQGHAPAVTAGEALALPRAVGVQFHPEATPAILQGWAERFTPPGLVDAAALAADSARHFPARDTARADLFAWLLRRAIAG